MPIKCRVPLSALGLNQLKVLLAAKDKFLQSVAIVKPQCMLGACWTSDKVAQRKPVVMCEECWRKYDGWWKRSHYRADWGWPYMGNCDGCSDTTRRVTLFSPEEIFYVGLGPNHGLNPKP